MLKTFMQFMEAKKDVRYELHKLPGTPGIHSFRSHSGPHEIHTTASPLGRGWSLDFGTDKSFMRSGEHIPAHHKAQLLRHLGRHLSMFMDKAKPHENGTHVKLEASKKDPDFERKRDQYANAAKLIANKWRNYDGTPADVNPAKTKDGEGHIVSWKEPESK